MPNNWFWPIAGLCAVVVLTGVHAAAADNQKDGRMRIYVGTSANKNGEGIYSVRFDPADGSLSDPQLAAETMNPSFIVLSKDKRFVYACNEVSKVGGKPTEAVTSFQVEPDTGKLKQVSQQSSGGQGPAHVSLSDNEQLLFTANYGGGSVASIAVDPATGSLGEVLSSIQHTGNSKDPRRQAAPHPHAILADPSRAFVLATDLGIDRLLVYQLDETGKLVSRASHDAILAPGSGPRSFVFSAGGRFVYLVNEMSNTITVLTWNAAAGLLTEQQTISSLAPGFTAASTGATIALHPNGKVLYVSNRSEPTGNISIFDIDSTSGRLTYRSSAPTGRAPRHFAIHPEGRWLICGNQNDGTIESFQIDPANGSLARTNSQVSIPKPSCIQFAD